MASVALAIGVALVPMSAFAQRNAWRSLHIDGSSPQAIEASVAALQNALPARERADFETALAVVWFSGATAAGDLDRDGDLEVGDVLDLSASIAELLAAIQRGDFVSAIQDLDEGGDAYTAAHYFEQLDELGYDEVLDLAGRPADTAEVGRAVKSAKAQVLCRGEMLPVRRKWCDAYYRSADAPRQPRIDNGNALARAIEAAKAGDDAAAERALASIDLDQLTSFDRGLAEAVQFNIAYRQKLFPDAREHLLAAVDAQVVPAAVAAGILETLDRFERAAARPRPPRLGGGRAPAPEAELGSGD